MPVCILGAQHRMLDLPLLTGGDLFPIKCLFSTSTFSAAVKRSQKESGLSKCL